MLGEERGTEWTTQRETNTPEETGEQNEERIADNSRPLHSREVAKRRERSEGRNGIKWRGWREREMVV